MEKEQKEGIQNENLAKEENEQATQPQDQTDDHKDKKDKKEEVKKELTPEEIEAVSHYVSISAEN